MTDARPHSPSGMPKALIFMLFLTYTLSYLDRQVVNIMAEHIKRDVGLADWQIGAMSGLAFALLYATLGMPVARIAERVDRVRIISIALLIWSTCTTLFGFGRSFIEFFLARLGVGLGEAGGTPPAMSMITDATPPAFRARALSLYNLGVPVGALLGMALGGFIVDALGWRWAFYLLGPPGILLAIVLRVTLRDPRQAERAESSAEPEVPGVGEVLKTLRGSGLFWWLTIGAALTAFVGYGQQAFMASFFLRNHAEALETTAIEMGLPGATTLLGIGLGIGFGLGGILGSILGGQLADRFRDRNAYVWVPFAGSVLAFPLYMTVLMMASAPAALALLVVPVALKSMWYGPVYTLVQQVVRQRSRTTVLAIFLFLLNMIGLGLGPLTIGLLSDSLAAEMGAAEGLRWALVAISGVSVLSGLFFLFALGPAARRLREEARS